MKRNTYLDRKELAVFFRQLADAVENGGQGEFACVDEFKKMKIGVKDEFGQLSLRVKIKTPDTCQAPEDIVQGEPPKPEYSTLKKRMKSSFRMLVKMIHDNQVPPAEAVESFLADSALMVTYAGYGDEYYDDYTQACETFRAAYESGDMNQMHAAVDALIHEKTRCHAKHD